MNSGPNHWQTLWEQANAGYVRVQQKSWDQPQREDWIETLDKAVKAAPGKVVLVAHSIGCVLIAHWVQARDASKVAAALFVAPADPERPGLAKELKVFAPMPLKPLPFPSLFVSSNNDTYSNIERAKFFARKWGSRMVEVGNLGHINGEAGIGDWPQGKALLEDLMKTAGCEA